MSRRVTKLRAIIDQQLSAAAREIFRLVRGCANGERSDLEQLRRLVTERVSAAVHVIFAALEEVEAGGGEGECGRREEGEDDRRSERGEERGKS